jgi:methylated-DNA-[protein]-cysteine S-methyltransferase
MNERRPTTNPATASASTKARPARPANRQERAGLGADQLNASGTPATASNPVFATRRPARPVSHSRSARSARPATPARQRMDTPMTATEGPTANRAAAGHAPQAVPATEKPVWPAGPGDQRAGSGGGGPVAFVDAAPAARAAGRRPKGTASAPSPISGARPSPGSARRQPGPSIDHQQAPTPGTASTNVTSLFAAATDAAVIERRLATHPVGIVATAMKPGVDACDIACDAMPAHVLGDLTPPEDAWLVSHTAGCGDCRNTLNRYQRVDSMLDTLQRSLEPIPAPPAFVPPASAKRPTPSAAAQAAPRRASYGTLESPIGPLLIAVTEAGVAEIGFAVNESEADFRHRLEERGFRPVPCLQDDLGPEAIARVTRQLEEYFTGRRDEFDLPLDLTGVSPFTRSVLAATTEVPFGHLATYRDIAQQIGAPGATRAVGNALGRNPIPVIVPCHRIVRSDATIGGYTGGLGIKKRLLAIEGIASPN